MGASVRQLSRFDMKRAVILHLGFPSRRELTECMPLLERALSIAVTSRTKSVGNTLGKDYFFRRLYARWPC